MVTTRSEHGPVSARPTASLTGSGERIDLTDRQLPQRIRRQRDPWQALAWNYRELIGELGAGIEYEANIISKVAFRIGQVGDGDEPVLDGTDEFDVPEHVARAAREALDRLPFRNGYAFTGILSTCLRVSGEAWLHGRTGKRRESWSVLSSDEVQPVNDTLGVVDAPGAPPVPIDKRNEVLLRLWRPHPRWKRLADSPLRRLLDTCEDIVLVGRELRAASRSRIAANGLLLVPNELSVVRKPDGATNDFQTELEFTLLAPIGNEGDAGAVVPVVLKGPAELLDKVRHITLERADAPELITKLNSGLARLREGMNIPPDANQSVRDMNHWSAWSVSTENWKNYLEPETRIIVDSLTEAYLRPSLVMPVSRGGGGLTEDEAELVQLWYDAGNITENANRGQDAKDAYDRGEIGGATLRGGLGFNDGDKPDAEEFQRMVTWKAASQITPEVVQALLVQALGPDVAGIRAATPGTRGGSVDVSRPRVEIERTPTAGGPGEQPTSPTPVRTPPGMVAAGTPGVRLVTGDELADIDRALRDRLIVAADLSLARALEKAGSRVRARAQRDGDLSARVNGLAADAVCPLVGRERIAEMGISEDTLLAQAFDYLAGKFATWTGQAVKDAARTVARLLGLPLTQVAELSRTLAGRIPTAWKALESRLRERTLAKLYGSAGDELRGEVPDSLVMPGDIRMALAEIGGLPPGGVDERGVPLRDTEVLGGLALGRDIVSLVEQRADRVGFSWKYGITPRERQFEPHRLLSGRRFAGWDDPALGTTADTAWLGTHFAPGDHDGCMCDYVPTWALADTDALVRAEIVREAPSMGTDRLLAELDDDAGRSGTWAQRSRDERDRILAVQREWLERTA